MVSTRKAPRTNYEEIESGASVDTETNLQDTERRDRKRRKLADGKEMVLASSVIVLNGNETNGQSNRKASSTNIKTRKKARRQQGFLADLPLELLYEIFPYVQLDDILAYSRASKTFRNLLMRKSAIPIWQTALENTPGLPPCPPDLELPQYANFLFGLYCHHCLTPLEMPSVLWRSRTRACIECSEDPGLYCDMLNLKIEFEKSRILAVQSLLPFDVVPLRYHPDNSLTSGKVLRTTAEALIQARERHLGWMPRSSEALKTWTESKRQLLAAIDDYARNCQTWLERWIQVKEAKKVEIRNQKQKQIIKRLATEDLAFSEELDEQKKYDNLHAFTYCQPFQSILKLVRPMSEKRWPKTKKSLLDLMGKLQIERIEEKKTRRSGKYGGKTLLTPFFNT